jgi:DNA-directed RNA polymerase subunit delta
VSELNINREQLEKYSMIEMAVALLKQEKKAMNYRDIFEEITELKQLDGAERDEAFAQFYTDLNLDGRFLYLGQGIWGLKVWYPVDQIDEEITEEPKKKKKKKKKAKKKEIEPSIDNPVEEEEEDLTEIPIDFIAKEDDEDDDDDLELDELDDDDLFDDEEDEEDYDDDEFDEDDDDASDDDDDKEEEI